MFGWLVLIAMVVLAFAGELLDVFAEVFGSRQAGATRRGALIWGIVAVAAFWP